MRNLAIQIAVLTLTGCASSTPAPSSKAPLQHGFPAGFLWGMATAGFQVDRGCPATN